MDLSSIDISTPLWQLNFDGYRYVLFSENKVLVYKGDKQEPSYEITSIGCSCPSDRYRSDMCKHRKVISWIGDGSSGIPVMQEPEVAGILAESQVINLNDLMG